MQDQHADADAGGALQVAFPGRGGLPGGPGPPGIPDEEAEDQADPEPAGFQPGLEIVVVGLVEEAAVQLFQRLDRAIDGIETADPGTERKVGLGCFGHQRPTIGTALELVLGVKAREYRGQGQDGDGGQCGPDPPDQHQQAGPRLAPPGGNPGGQQAEYHDGRKQGDSRPRANRREGYDNQAREQAADPQGGGPLVAASEGRCAECDRERQDNQQKRRQMVPVGEEAGDRACTRPAPQIEAVPSTGQLGGPEENAGNGYGNTDLNEPLSLDMGQ